MARTESKERKEGKRIFRAYNDSKLKTQECQERELNRKKEQIKWELKIREMHEKGLSAPRIYLAIVYEFRKNQGYDPEKIIEKLTGENIERDSKGNVIYTSTSKRKSENDLDDR